VDGNGTVDLDDAIIVLKFMCGIQLDNRNISPGADCNDDGIIGREEIIYILQKISGMRK
jgi:hypothetical protein